MNTSIVDLLEAYPIPEQKEKPPYQIYCDMDGVLTDFEGRFEHFTGMHPQEYEKQKGLAAFWNLIDVEIGVRFWIGMNFMPQGKELWNFISPYRPHLLTSPSRDNNSRLGKNLWVRNNLNPKPKVIFAYSADKQRYANENSILIIEDIFLYMALVSISSVIGFPNSTDFFSKSFPYFCLYSVTLLTESNDIEIS